MKERRHLSYQLNAQNCWRCDIIWPMRNLYKGTSSGSCEIKDYSMTTNGNEEKLSYSTRKMYLPRTLGKAGTLWAFSPWSPIETSFFPHQFVVTVVSWWKAEENYFTMRKYLLSNPSILYVVMLPIVPRRQQSTDSNKSNETNDTAVTTQLGL